VTQPSDAQLSAYLEEALPVEQLAQIEQQLRDDLALRQRLVSVIGRQDAGLHSVGDIWRRNRLSCPGREELGQYILGVLDRSATDYIDFHIQEIGCRYCIANLDDLRSAQRDVSAAAQNPASARRHRYFQTSAGHLRSTGDATGE
jgi:hypothetical protein